MSAEEKPEVDRRVESVVTDKRVKMVLTVDISGTLLTREFVTPWTKEGEPAVDSNHQFRQVELAFRELCRTWGIQNVEGSIVSVSETRLTRKVVETEMTSSSKQLDLLSYDLAAEERARKEFD